MSPNFLRPSDTDPANNAKSLLLAAIAVTKPPSSSMVSPNFLALLHNPPMPSAAAAPDFDMS